MANEGMHSCAGAWEEEKVNLCFIIRRSRCYVLRKFLSLYL